MDYKDIICSQYHASLEMLKSAIVKCPPALWNDPGAKTKFWHVAYHALFYTHLYLQNSEQTFNPWARHKPNYQFMGPVPWPPHDKPKLEEPYSQEDILAYLEFCQNEVEEKMVLLNPDDESGFSWLPFTKMELQIYNIRHLQQHTGELMERLGSQANIEVDWVGMKHT